MASAESESGCAFGENGGILCDTISPTDSSPLSGAIRKPSKKSLSQLHEQLLKKAGCVVSSIAPPDSSRRTRSSTDSSQHHTSVKSENSLSTKSSHLSSVVSLDLPSHDSSVEPVTCEDVAQNGKHLSGHDGGREEICLRDNVTVPKTGGFDTTSHINEQSNESGYCKVSLNDLDMTNTLHSEGKKGVLDQVVQSNHSTMSCEEFSAAASVENNVGELVGKERSKSRKASKPMKRGLEELDIKSEQIEDSLVVMNFASVLAVRCKSCSFTCCTNEQLSMHESTSHCAVPTSSLPFVCRECKHATDLRDVFERHVAHHTGQHTVRYYQCPYCCFDTNDMMSIESHISEYHASENFRFEVTQNTISYLQRLLECPVCRGLYQWRNDFLTHLHTSHSLESLVSYLELSFGEQSTPTALSAPQSLFNGLMQQQQRRKEECVVCEPTAADDEASDAEVVEFDESEQDPWSNDTMDVELCDPRSKDNGLSIRFHCSACDFSTEDYNLYQHHSRAHTTTSTAEDKHLASTSSSGNLVISAGATNLVNGGLLGSKGGAKTLYQCHLCPFECLKQVHYRRHLTIHERNERLREGYRCGYCHFAHNRLNCVKFHLGKYHSKHPIKLSRIVDGVVVELSETDLYALRSRRSNRGLSSASMVKMPSRESGWSLSNRDLTVDCLLAGLEAVNNTMFTDDQDLVLASNDTDHLDFFEQQLPPAMIYTDPVKCPKCDFTNRVRINLIKHLKLHKDEMDLGGDTAAVEGIATAQSDAGSLAAGVYHAISDGSLDNSVTTTSSRLELLLKSHEKPLLRQILSEKPMPLKTEAVDYDVDDDEAGVVFEEREVTKTSQLSAQQQQDYGEFCSKLLNSELFQCHRCDFTNRFPSKVKRHFYYRHAKVPPYRCGHCPFEAVERGKVARHSQLVHRSLPVVVVQQEVEIVPLSKTTDAANHQSTVVFEPMLGDASNDVLTKITDVASIFGIKEEQLDLDSEAPLIDYYPKLEVDTWNEDSPSGRNSSETRSLSESQASQPEAESSLHGSKSHTGSRMCRRQFRCGHCGVVSRWNRRDIILHVMHVHLRRRVYTCKHCSFGNSKSKALVRAHCIKFHPQRAVSVRDDTALLNAIMANEGPDGVVTMAFAPYGTPMVDSQELANYLHEHKHNLNDHSKDLRSNAKQRTGDAEGNDKLPVNANNCDFDITKVEREMTGVENLQLMKALKIPTELYRDDRRPWRCRLCGFTHSRVVRVKYHIICRHLKVKPFCCPYCKLYLWKSQAVLSHVDKCHPGCKRHALATVDEQASFLRRNIERMSTSAMPQLSHAMSASATGTKVSSVRGTGSAPSRPGLFRCKLCGYQDARNDKTKYHIVKQHLKLRQFSCPYCHVYLWGRQQVAKHVEEQHPGFEIRIQRTFHEYEEFLRNNICRVDSSQAGKPKSSSRAPPLSTKSVLESHSAVTLNRASTLVSRLPCDLCSFVTDSELSLSAHRRSHRLFQCAHCRFRHALVAKVQSHCLSAHPSKPVHYKQWTPTAPPVLSPSVNVGANEKPITEAAGNDAAVLKFYPCDLCPAHFSSQSALDSHVVQMHSGVFMCQYCRLVTSDKESMEKHQQDDHVFRVPSFEVICPQKVAEATSNSVAVRKQPLPLDVVSGSSGVVNDVNDSATFKCRLCNYGCTKLTVMRHHVMSHLRYHPFICPYCSLVRSVKSFPIKKHVRLKHPGSEERVLFVQNDVLEKKVKSSFYRVKKLKTDASKKNGYNEKNSSEDGDDVEVIDEDVEEQPPPLVKEVVLDTPPVSQTGQHKVLYRCKMCGLKTHIRMDMRHHLMREIHYKPYKCAYCPYTEPCRWSMRKHFRTRHAGIEVALTDLRDPEQDRRVEQLVEECTIPLKDTSDTWKPQTNFSKTNAVAWLPTNFTAIRPEAAAKRPAANSKPVMMSGASLRLHRCTQCSYTTSNLKLLRGHIVKHGPYRLQCAYCDYRGHYPSRIYKHIRRHHRGCAFRVVKVNDALPLPPPVTTVAAREPLKLHKRAKPLPGTVYLDGVALNLLLTPDQEGRFQCDECEYQTTNREHYKMHVVIHRPPKWQCFYCDQKYPLVFRLRRHSHSKHPDKLIKWIDLQSGQVCVDLQRNADNVVEQPVAADPVRKQTARKSTSKAGMKVALFRSALFNKKKNASPRNGDVEEMTQSDGDDFLIIDESDTNEEYDERSSGDDESVARPAASILRFRCHLCPFSVLALSPSALAQHLNETHAGSNYLPTVEILPANDAENADDDAAVLALYRCGLCMFESFVREDFDDHVLKSHNLDRPFACDLCQDFASFSRAAVEEHSTAVHSCPDPQVTRLDRPYTMVADESGGCEQKGRVSYNFEAFVPLEDVLNMTDDQMSSLLLSFEVASADLYV